MPPRGFQMVSIAKFGLVTAPTFTLKVLVKLRLCQNVPFFGMNNLYFLKFSQKCCPGASR